MVQVIWIRTDLPVDATAVILIIKPIGKTTTIIENSVATKSNKKIYCENKMRYKNRSNNHH